MTRPLVLLDCDGVLSDFVGHFLSKLGIYYGIHYERDAVTRFNFENLPGWEGIKRQAWDLCRDPLFCATMPVLPGSVDGVRRLREIADVEVCTSPMHGAPTWTSERDEWLERHFGFHHRDVHHVRKKYRMRADYLIDDSGENCHDWVTNGAGEALLWDRSYNRTFAYTRVTNWDEVLERIR